MLEKFDSETDLNEAMKTSKLGTVSVNPKTLLGTYSYSGGAPESIKCESKYFIQLNPHTKGNGKMTDQQACALLNEVKKETGKLETDSPKAEK